MLSHEFVFCNRTVKAFNMCIKPFDDVFFYFFYECRRRTFLLLKHLVQFGNGLFEILVLLFVRFVAWIFNLLLKLFFGTKVENCII